MEPTRWRAEGELWVYLAALGETPEEDWPGLFAQMDPERQEKCRRYRREEDRRRCVLADALARTALARAALARAAGLPPQAIRFGRREGGKPYPLDLGWEFSLSHSGPLVLCAVAPFPVGADIQLARPLSPALTRRLARAGYSGSREEDFWRWWVRQEAAGKLSGRGLSLAPLPPGLAFHTGALTAGEGRFYWCVCRKKGLPFSETL